MGCQKMTSPHRLRFSSTEHWSLPFLEDAGCKCKTNLQLFKKKEFYIGGASLPRAFGSHTFLGKENFKKKMFDKQVDIDDESVVEVDDVTETYAIYEVFKVVLVGSRWCN